jgi:hypothetical protein
MHTTDRCTKPLALNEFRAALPEGMLIAVRRHAEEALVTDGVACMRLGYEVLVELKMDEFLEQACVQMPASANGAHPPAEVTVRR